MALGCSSLPRRKRLCKDDRVEVRSLEEGLHGSWHSGALIETEFLDSEIKYVVKYDHMLVDDESDYFIETLLVNENEVCNLRGRIRPFPPLVNIVNWDIYYGLCVDVYYNDGWWEGVVFDHEDGLEMRNVFFPDLTDEIKTPITNMRISQDWNEATGNWKNRGTWFFLELLEELEDENWFHIKPKEFWLDLRQKDKIQKLGDWTSSDKQLWSILVRETLRDKLKYVEGRLSDLVRIPELKGSDESANLINVNVQQCQSDVSVHQQAVSVLPQDLSVVKYDTYSSAKEGVFSSSGGNNISGEYKTSNCKKNSWLPAGSDMVPAAEFCPDAIIKYLQRGKKDEVSVIDVRQHLLHLHWKIEYSKQERTRLRYTSPDGKVYYSLRQVCLILSEHTEKNSSITQDENGGPLSSPGDSPSPLSEELSENQVSVVSSHSDIILVEPEYCPEAAVDWYTYKKMRSSSNKGEDFQEMSLRARKHLSALGWQFKRVTLRSGKRELRYISPEGKVYASLRLACRDSSGSSASACRHREGKAVSKVQADAACQKIPSSLILKFRNPFALQKSKVGGIKKIHWKRKERLLLSSSLHKQKDISETQYSLAKLSRKRKTRCLIELQKNGERVLRTSKRVKQVAVPNPSHQKPLTVLSWLIDNNIVLPRAKVHFYSRSGTHSTAGGRITREGIKCNCCCTVYTLSGFKFHVSGKCHKPAASICLEDGSSLLDCQKKIIHKEMGKFVEEPLGNLNGSLHQGENDSICSVCHYGGELLLCDQCPSSFHKSCLGLVDVPEGDWFCPSCCCKICGHNKLKRDTEFSIEDDAVLNCTQCERKCHIWCIRNRGITCLKNIPRGNWFCTKKCKEIFLGLNELLGKPIPVGSSNLTWTLLKPDHSDSHKLDTLSDEAWIENCSKLNIAVDMMHECFEPVQDPHTKRDLLKDVIFNKRSELKRLNFGGFYTVILQKDDEFISVATIRVYGEKVAELPLVGTRCHYRRLGMCRILMNVLEKKLLELGVERLVLPAVPCVLSTWTGSFGFSKLTDSERLQIVDYTFLDFQDTVMCHKQLMKIPSAEPCPSRAILPRLDNYADASYDNVDLEGSNAVSEVFQVDQIQAGTSEQGQAEYADASYDNMDHEGSNSVSEVFQANQIQAGTSEQGQADGTTINSTSHAEGPIDLAITLNSESEPCAEKISTDCSAGESSGKQELSENNGGNSLNLETGDGVGGLMVYTRRSEKDELNGKLRYYKRRRL
ncbi:increased DNA methylation 1-like [Euphorbia lathyris]|uniref:increased DNA methylation 1-like n=1 Tax=Euphorbia lathyris TaxID=212925 RepID=UPI00331388EB